jgi:AraC family transcriptional regulator of adaptative response/methylated-DNA-[protein]-cysteine methyltransferase
VLETALNTGLSGPGRLHDLFVSVEAATPGEFKTRGAGIQISYGFHATPFGICLLGATQRGVCWLSFINEKSQRETLRELKAHWSGAQLAERPGVTGPLVRQIFSDLRHRTKAPLSLLLMGTNFQLQVWRALLRIPEGTVTSYERIGAVIGASNAARAIGAAVGGNSVAYLIPCHRVIRKTGLLGGYRWGEPRKRAMLGWEAARTTIQL